VLELGCGISGLVSLALAGRVAKYVNTDQEYVLKLARENVGNNYEVFCGAGKGGSARKKGAGRRDVGARKPVSAGEDQIGNVLIRGLDWETSSMEHLYKDVGVDHLDLLVSCDCIYNEALVEPLATTMREICKLATDTDTPTICVVAQQLRSPDVLEAWLKSFCSYFKVWRIPDELLDAGLREGSGYVVHVGVVR
jgi:predicted nicotinamide N-methyase